MYLSSRLLAKRDTSRHIMNQRLRLICLGAAALAAGCGAVRTDSRPQQHADGNGYGEEKAASKVAVVNAYKPMKFDMSSGGGAASNNVMYTSGAAPGGAMYASGAAGGGAMVATAAHPYSYEEAAPASTYIIPNYAEEHHAPNFGGGYIGVPHKTSFLPGHKYRPPGVKFDLHQ